MPSENPDAQLEEEARVLTDQAKRFLKQFDVDLSSAESFVEGSAAYRAAADAYERLALTEKTVGDQVWFGAANVDGRDARAIMDRLWRVRERLRRRDEKSRREE
jgi:hypothetical protein